MEMVVMREIVLWLAVGMAVGEAVYIGVLCRRLRRAQEWMAYYQRYLAHLLTERQSGAMREEQRGAGER